VDFNSPPIRRGVYETELCLRIVDPLDEQAAVGYALRVIRDEHDVPSFHLLGRDHLDVILPKFILCGVFNDPGPEPKLEFGQHLCVSPDNEARAVKFVRALAAPHIRRANLLNRYVQGRLGVFVRNKYLARCYTQVPNGANYYQEEDRQQPPEAHPTPPRRGTRPHSE